MGKQRLRPNTQIDTMTSPTLEGVTNLKQGLFLGAYAQLGNVAAAARVAKVPRRSHYSWLDEPEYAAAFAVMRKEAVDMLREEARRLAVNQVEQPIFYRGKVLFETKRDPKTGEMRPTKKRVTVRRYGDTLLMLLLKALRPEKYRSRPQGPDLSLLSEEDRKQLDQIVRKIEGRQQTSQGSNRQSDESRRLSQSDVSSCSPHDRPDHTLQPAA